MKNVVLSIPIFIGVFLILLMNSCKKRDPLPTKTTISNNQSAQNDFYREYQSYIISTCAGSPFQIDLDGDSLPDAQISLLCGNYYHYHCSTGSYTAYYNMAKLDTFWNNKFSICCAPNSQYDINQLSLGDTVQASDSYTQQNLVLLNHTFIDYEYVDPRQGFNTCDSSVKYIGFEKVVSGRTKYGWFAIHFDSQYNVYLNAIYLSGIPNKPVRAGLH